MSFKSSEDSTIWTSEYIDEKCKELEKFLSQQIFVINNTEFIRLGLASYDFNQIASFKPAVHVDKNTNIMEFLVYISLKTGKNDTITIGTLKEEEMPQNTTPFAIVVADYLDEIVIKKLGKVL